MKGSRKKTKAILPDGMAPDTYMIYFWKRDSEGFRRPTSDWYSCDGKDKHEEAAKAIVARHKIKADDIISVRYQ